jgi:hypothetical protein
VILPEVVLGVVRRVAVPQAVAPEEDHGLAAGDLVHDAGQHGELPALARRVVVVEVPDLVDLHPAVVARVEAPHVVAVVLAAVAARG